MSISIIVHYGITLWDYLLSRDYEYSSCYFNIIYHYYEVHDSYYHHLGDTKNAQPATAEARKLAESFLRSMQIAPRPERTSSGGSGTLAAEDWNTVGLQIWVNLYIHTHTYIMLHYDYIHVHYVYMYIYICIHYVYIYAYIMCIYIYIMYILSIHTYTHTLCFTHIKYIYIHTHITYIMYIYTHYPIFIHKSDFFHSSKLGDFPAMFD